MATNPFDLIEPTWRSLGHLEYGFWMVRFGEALAKHEDHQGENAIPRPLAGGAQIIEGGNQMIGLARAAEGGDRFRKAELDAYRPQADLLVSATVNWVVTRSIVENRPSVRGNLHLEEKKREKKLLKNPAPLGVTAPTTPKVKRSDNHSSIVYVSVGRILMASMYYVQICQGDPTDQSAWVDAAQADSCRNIEIKGLTPGAVYHFRVRCYGSGVYSPWSQVVTVRVL
ncbi:hypothetical protein GMSM_39670 [Geomonas sp. Red276]